MSTNQQIYTSIGPPVQSFPVSELEKHINVTEKDKPRKPAVKLEDCKLMEMVQYNCLVVEKARGKEVECRPLLRLFRQCQNGLTVETTEWEYSR